MASSLALNRVTASSLFNKLGNPIRSVSIAPFVARSFNSNAPMTTLDSGDRAVDVERRSDRLSRRGDSALAPSFLPDVFNPFSPTTSLRQMLNVMDQLMDPFMGAPRGLMGAGSSRRGWDVKEDNEALYIRMDMPGVNKEKVKITVEQNTLVIKGEGEGEKESEDEEQVRRYSSRIDLPMNLYKVDEMKAEMKNGVLKIKVPKVREEERKNVIQVPVE